MVKAVTNAVILPPILSQLIKSVNLATASFIFSPISLPIPAKSPALNISFSCLAKSLIPLFISAVSNIFAGDMPPAPPPPAPPPLPEWSLFASSCI